MQYFIDDISLLKTDFFKGFRGNLYEDEVGDVYQVTTSTHIKWVYEPGQPSYSENLDKYLTQVGSVKLQAIGNPSDLFYSQEVVTTEHNLLHEEPFAFQGYGFGEREFWIDGAKHGNIDLEAPICNQILFGLYEDDYNRILESDTEYEVTLYIHYED